MSGPFLKPQEHLLELLAARATGTLSVAEAQELEWLMHAFPELVSDQLERAAAAADLALGPTTFEPLPAPLRARLLAMAHQQFAIELAKENPTAGAVSAPVQLAPAESRSPSPQPRPSKFTWAWLVAAASLLLALWGWWPTIVALRGSALAEERAELLRRRSLRASLTDPASGHPHGDVVWSESERRGYMRLTGLKPNDPSREQYQLWIFDANQDERYPIDGGVFDIEGGGAREVIVPIHAAIRVGKPIMFAVTLEKPGGVVVSDRQRIVALGKVEG